jgi:hypothetical protein
MGSYKRVFDPLDLEIIDLVYEAALVQIAARDPLSDPIKEQERQEALKKLVFAVAQPGSVEFDHLLDKVLQYASQLSVSPATPRPGSRQAHEAEAEIQAVLTPEQCASLEQSRAVWRLGTAPTRRRNLPLSPEISACPDEAGIDEPC